MDMPTLSGERVAVRRFTMDDLDAVHRILDVEIDGLDGAEHLAARRRWLEWSVRNYDALASLYQPPYGDRAVILRETGELIGACGLAPALMPFDQLPSRGAAGSGLNSPEVGLYWAISPAHQRRGYAAAAGRLLIDYAFDSLPWPASSPPLSTTTRHRSGSCRSWAWRLSATPAPSRPGCRSSRRWTIRPAELTTPLKAALGRPDGASPARGTEALVYKRDEQDYEISRIENYRYNTNTLLLIGKLYI